MKENELTRYAFMSHMKDYMKELLKNPLKADTDEFLHGFGIDGPSALKMLIKKTDPNDEYSSVVIRSERIKDNGYDENGNRNKDTFEVKYKIPRKDFKKKLRNLYINLFEQNIVKENLTEGAWGYGILDNDSALDHQTDFSKICLKVLTSKVRKAQNDPSYAYQELWANVGVLVDFLKKYKDDEIQLCDEYTAAIKIVKKALYLLYNDENAVSAWSEPDKFKSSIKKVYKDVSLLEYQKDIMNIEQSEQDDRMEPPVLNQPINEDGEGGAVGGGAMDGMGGATTTFTTGEYQYTTPLRTKNKKSDVIRKTVSKQIYVTEEQIKYIKEATTTTNTGEYQFTVPLQGDDEDFYGEAMDHQNIMKKSFETNK